MSPRCVILCPKVGANDGTGDTKEEGSLMRPKMIPTIDVNTIPTKIAAGICIDKRTNVTIMPKIANNEVGDVR